MNPNLKMIKIFSGLNMVNILRTLLLAIFFSCSVAQTEESFSQSTEKEVIELARQIIRVRSMLVSQNAEFPPLTDFFETFRCNLIYYGLELDESIFNALYAEFEAFEIRGAYE